MGDRDYTATVRARRYVARCAAAILSRDAENAWLVQDDRDPAVTVPEHEVRRRQKALNRLVARLRREAEKGGA